MSAKPAPKSRRGVFGRLRRRTRLVVGAAAMVIAFFVIPGDIRMATRALIAWNVGAWLFLALIAAMMTAKGPIGAVRAHAAEEDENQIWLLILTLVAGFAAMAAIVWELGPVKDMTGLRKAEHIGLVAATILSVWTFIHVMFALHYVAEYYAPRQRRGARRA